MAGSAVDLVPFRARQRHVRGFADICQVVGIHRSRNQLHICRMAQDPRRHDSRFGQTVFFTDLGKLCIQFGEILIVNVSSLEKSVLKRRPRLNRHLFDAAVFQKPAVVHL